MLFQQFNIPCFADILLQCFMYVYKPILLWLPKNKISKTKISKDKRWNVQAYFTWKIGALQDGF